MIQEVENLQSEEPEGGEEELCGQSWRKSVQECAQQGREDDDEEEGEESWSELKV